MSRAGIFKKQVCLAPSLQANSLPIHRFSSVHLTQTSGTTEPHKEPGSLRKTSHASKNRSRQTPIKSQTVSGKDEIQVPVHLTDTCVLSPHTHTHAHTHMHAHTHAHTCMHMHTRTHTNACLHTHTCVCTHMHTCACTHTCMHIHMHTCVPACTCVHMHTHTHVGAHTLCHLPLPSMSPNDAPAPLTTGPGSKVHFSAPRGLVGRTPRAPATSGNPVRLPGLGTSLASCPRLRERCQPGTGPGISGPHREERVTGNHL